MKMYALQLYFDPVTDTIVRGLWHRFDQMSIARRLHESANRPHLTLAVYADLDVVRAEQTLIEFARFRAPFSLTFSSLGSFSYPADVAFLAPTVTVDLLRFHRLVHQAFAKIGMDPHEYYLPGFWVPHCTIAFHMEAHALPMVFEASHDLRLPLTGAVTEIGVVEVSPTTPLFSIKLGSEQ